MSFLSRLSAVLLAASCSFAATAAMGPSFPTAESKQFIVVSQETWLGHRGAGEMFRVDKRGRPVVLVEVTEAEIAGLSQYIHDKEFRCGGFFSFDSREEAEAFIAAEPVLRQPLGGYSYTIDNQSTVNQWLPQVSEANIRSTIAWLESYQNRYYNSSHGQQSSIDIMMEWMEIAGSRSDVSVETVSCSGCGQQFSVILTIQGQTLPDEIVVLGGHLDSISSGASGNPEGVRAPGADDDASGIAVLTETLRIALSDGWKPQRTVKVMGYANEEGGLRGSRAIADSFASNRQQVYAVLQFDMTNYTTSWTGKKDLFVFTDNVDPTLTQFVRDLFDTYLAPLGLTRGQSSCGYGCSDHAAWTEKGYPAALVFETDMGNRNSRIHTADDTLANMGDSAQHSVTFAKMALAFLGETAKTHSVVPEEPEEPLPSEIFKHGFESNARN